MERNILYYAQIVNLLIGTNQQGRRNNFFASNNSRLRYNVQIATEKFINFIKRSIVMGLIEKTYFVQTLEPLHLQDVAILIYQALTHQKITPPVILGASYQRDAFVKHVRSIGDSFLDEYKVDISKEEPYAIVPEKDTCNLYSFLPMFEVKPLKNGDYNGTFEHFKVLINKNIKRFDAAIDEFRTNCCIN